MAHIHGVFDSDAHFSVDPITKTLKNESSQKTTVIQKDHNSERFTFEIPRIIEGHDMSLCNDVKVHYINIDASTKQENKGVYAVDDLQISQEDDQVIICSWLVSGNATQLKGPLSFSISYSCVTDDLDYCLNTAAYKAISVAEGVYCGDYVAEEYADILVKWEQELVDAGGVTDEQVQEALNAYLAEHGITENDPTVPDWAKAAEKPGYNLSELTEDANHRTVTDAEKTAWNNKSNFSGNYNDLTNKPTIPAAYSLPIANASTLGGVKPVAKTSDMTQAVGVDGMGALFTIPGGGGSGGESGGGGNLTVELIGTVESDGESVQIEEACDISEDGLYGVSAHMAANLATNNTTNQIRFFVGAQSIYVSALNFNQDANASNTIGRRAGVVFAVNDKKAYVLGAANYSMTGLNNFCESGVSILGSKLLLYSSSNIAIPTGITMKVFRIK